MIVYVTNNLPPLQFSMLVDPAALVYPDGQDVQEYAPEALKVSLPHCSHPLTVRRCPAGQSAGIGTAFIIYNIYYILLKY